MPPPPSFVDIATVPFNQTITQAQFNGGTFGGTANTCWFRRITTAQVGLGVFTDTGGTFKADTTIYESDGSTVVKASTSAANISFYAIVATGTYYIKVVRHGGGASDFDFTTQVDERPTDADVLPLTVGQIVINDDTNGFPTTVLNADGTVAGFLTTIPAGETSAFLPTGESLWHDRFGMVGPANQMAVFDADLVYVTSVDLGLSSPLPIVTHSDSAFYVLDRSNGEVWKITTVGTALDLNFVTPDSGVASAAAADPDGMVLYWLEDSGSAALHRYDLIGMAPLSDLATISGVDPGADTIAKTPNGHPGDLLLLTDGTFVTWYQDDSAGDWKLIHLDATGAVIDAFSFGGGGIDHLFPYSDATHVGIWLFTTVNLNEGHIGIVDLTDGSVASDFTRTLFNSGENLQTDDDTLFSPSASCTIFSIGVLQGGGGGGGGPAAGGIIGPLAWVHWPRLVPGNPPGSP